MGCTSDIVDGRKVCGGGGQLQVDRENGKAVPPLPFPRSEMRSQFRSVCLPPFSSLLCPSLLCPPRPFLLPDLRYPAYPATSSYQTLCWVLVIKKANYSRRTAARLFRVRHTDALFTCILCAHYSLPQFTERLLCVRHCSRHWSFTAMSTILQPRSPWFSNPHCDAWS